MSDQQDDTRPFPIQGGYDQEADGSASRPIRHFDPCTVPWWVAEAAYESYEKSGGRGQSLEELAARGGFGRQELISLIRREFEQ